MIKLAHFFQVDEADLLKLWLADKVYEVIDGETNINEVFDTVAENIVEYKRNK